MLDQTEELLRIHSGLRSKASSPAFNPKQSAHRFPLPETHWEEQFISCSSIYRVSSGVVMFHRS